FRDIAPSERQIANVIHLQDWHSCRGQLSRMSQTIRILATPPTPLNHRPARNIGTKIPLYGRNSAFLLSLQRNFASNFRKLLIFFFDIDLSFLPSSIQPIRWGTQGVILYHSVVFIKSIDDALRPQTWQRG